MSENRNAYWLSPKNKIIKPKMFHIGTVIDHPEKFGETDRSVESTYLKYDEPISPTIEGKAREEILLRVVKRGYIRIRKGVSRRNQRWSIQVYKLNTKANDMIWEWANKVISDGIADDPYADVIIHEISKGNKMIRTSLDKIAAGGDIKESIGGVRRRLTEAEVGSIKIYDHTEMDQIENWKDYCQDLPFIELSEFAQSEVFMYRMNL